MNKLKPEDVMRALEICAKPYSQDKFQNCKTCPYWLRDCDKEFISDVIALLREKDAEIERLTKERDDARRDCAIAEQLHYECKMELEEMSDDILDSVRAERDRYKAESDQYQSAMLKAQAVCVEMGKLNQVEIAKARAEAITEFAERLKQCTECMGECTVDNPLAETYSVVREEYIDQITKEMKEENES
jgi:hypothetical protein